MLCFNSCVFDVCVCTRERKLLNVIKMMVFYPHWPIALVS